MRLGLLQPAGAVREAHGGRAHGPRPRLHRRCVVFHIHTYVYISSRIAYGPCESSECVALNILTDPPPFNHPPPSPPPPPSAHTTGLGGVFGVLYGVGVPLPPFVTRPLPQHLRHWKARYVVCVRVELCVLVCVYLCVFVLCVYGYMHPCICVYAYLIIRSPPQVTSTYTPSFSFSFTHTPSQHQQNYILDVLTGPFKGSSSSSSAPAPAASKPKASPCFLHCDVLCRAFICSWFRH